VQGSERGIRTANGGQDGGDKKVIGDSDISVAREGEGVREGCGRVWREGPECGG